MTTSHDDGGRLRVAAFSRLALDFLVTSSSLPARATMADRPEAAGRRA
jgi:hypothetical protein